MKRIKFFTVCTIASLAVSVMSCNGNASSQSTEQSTDSIEISTVEVENVDVAVEEVIEAEVTITRGVYKITSNVLARTAPSVNAKPATKNGMYADVSIEKLYLTTGDFVEATGTVKDGFAEVKDHLTEEGCTLWDDEIVWVPLESLHKVKK